MSVIFGKMFIISLIIFVVAEQFCPSGKAEDLPTGVVVTFSLLFLFSLVGILAGIIGFVVVV